MFYHVFYILILLNIVFKIWNVGKSKPLLLLFVLNINDRNNQSMKDKRVNEVFIYDKNVFNFVRVAELSEIVVKEEWLKFESTCMWTCVADSRCVTWQTCSYQDSHYSCWTGCNLFILSVPGFDWLNYFALSWTIFCCISKVNNVSCAKKILVFMSCSFSGLSKAIWSFRTIIT